VTRLVTLAALLAQLQVSLLGQAQVTQSSTRGDDLAAAAKAVFASKCIQCHGPELRYPRAGFGYITDMRSLVASDRYVIPGKPEQSEIWAKISEGDMPPDGAKAGPLTQAETDAIRAWIVAGAPVPPDSPSANPASDVHDSSMRSIAPKPVIAGRHWDKIAVAERLTWAVGLYLATGVAVGIPFVLRGVDRVDAGAKASPWGFRVLILPCAVALWPAVLRWWVAACHRRSGPSGEHA